VEVKNQLRECLLAFRTSSRFQGFGRNAVNLQFMDELNEQEILDLPEKTKKKKSEFFYLRMVSVGLLCLGAFFRFQHWPFASLMLISGLALWSIWNVIFLVSLKKPSFYEVAYGIGRLCVSIGIVLSFIGFKNGGLAFLAIAIIGFVAGIFGSFFAKNPQP